MPRGYVRTDAENIPAVHILIEWKLGGLLRGSDDALVEGRREARKTDVDSTMEPVDRWGELAGRVVVVGGGNEFLVLFIYGGTWVLITWIIL
jgi:hypothetical protein